MIESCLRSIMTSDLLPKVLRRPKDMNNNVLQKSAVNRKRFLILIGGLGLIGVVATIGFIQPSQRGSGFDHTLQAGRSRSVRSTVRKSEWTVQSVRDLAKSVGSTWIAEDTKNVCDTQGCLDTAVKLLKSIDFNIDPCTNFYEFSCGRWKAENPIPPINSRWSQFNLLRDRVNNLTQEILVSKNTEDMKPINQVKEYFKGCTDLAALEKVGVQPIRNILRSPGHGDWPILLGLKEWDFKEFNWLKTVADLRRTYMDTALLSVYVDQDARNSDDYAIYLDQPTLVVPRDVLINEGGAYDAILASYRTYITGTVQLLTRDQIYPPSPDQISKDAAAIVRFEAKLAAIMSKDEDRSDVDRMYNLYLLPQYQKLTDSYGDLKGYLGVGLDWKSLLNTIFSSSGVKLREDQRVIVSEPTYFKSLIRILLATEPRTIANYIQFRYVSGLAAETTQDMRDLAFKFNQALSGAKQPPAREKICADSANDGFGFAIGVQYIKAADFDDESKTQMIQMVDNLRASFNEIVEATTWMDPKTKEVAVEKLKKMKPFLGFPDWLHDKAAVEKYYAGLELVPSDHFASVTRLSQWSMDKSLAKLFKPVDREEWLTYPGVVNAFYAPTYNSITFPAGILQTPFFDRNAPKSINYGGIGLVIGHEITHGFDNSGRQYNGKGDASPWWTNETLQSYMTRSDCIQEQYSNYRPAGSDLHVNGKLTLGENIADNGGLHEAYLAYLRYIQAKGKELPLPGLEKLEPEQLVFLGFSNIWCENITPQALLNQLLTDPHSPAQFRVIGSVSNSPYFAEKWKCSVGSAMNPAKEKRCTLW